jgi:hypothetical protein
MTIDQTTEAQFQPDLVFFSKYLSKKKEYLRSNDIAVIIMGVYNYNCQILWNTAITNVD